MRYLHERGRSLITEIANSLDGYAKGQPIQATIILEGMASYVALLRQHIHQEDTIFFPMAEKEISGIERKSLIREFKKEDKGNGKIFADRQKLIQEMNQLL